MEQPQAAGAQPSNSPDLKNIDPLIVDFNSASDNFILSDPSFLDQFYLGGDPPLDNFNLDDPKESVAPPESHSPMRSHHVSGAASYSLEETEMDPHFLQSTSGPPFYSLPSTHVDSPFMNMQAPNTTGLLHLVSQHENSPAPISIALMSPNKSQELPIPNATHPLYSINPTISTPEQLAIEPVGQSTASPARILGPSSFMQTLTLPQSFSQPLATPAATPKGRGRRSGTQPSVSSKSAKRSRTEPDNDDTDSNSDSDSDNEDTKLGTQAAERRSRHTSSASRASALLNPEDDYKQRRARNNEAVRKSREKAKQKTKDTAFKLEQSIAENKRLKSENDHLKTERNLYQEILQKFLPGMIGIGQAGENTAATNPAQQVAVNALLQQLALKNVQAQTSGASTSRVTLPPSVALRRSPSGKR